MDIFDEKAIRISHYKKIHISTKNKAYLIRTYDNYGNARDDNDNFYRIVRDALIKSSHSGISKERLIRLRGTICPHNRKSICFSCRRENSNRFWPKTALNLFIIYKLFTN